MDCHPWALERGWKQTPGRKYNGLGSRMKRRDHSAAVGLCASLVMHAGIVAALLVFYVKDMDARRWWEEADSQRGRAEAVARPEADRMIWRDGEFGETKGAGEAMNSLEGDEP